jgi:hypothetical protein
MMQESNSFGYNNLPASLQFTSKSRALAAIVHTLLVRHFLPPERGDNMKNSLLLSMALTAAAFGTVTLLHAQSTVNRGGQHLEGAWIDATQNLLVTFTTSGGVISQSPATGVGPQGVQLLTGGHGSWIRTGDREFAVTTINFRGDTTGAFTGYAKPRWSVKLNDTLDELTGTYKTDIFDAAGNVVRSLTGQIQMKRIAVEPLEP